MLSLSSNLGFSNIETEFGQNPTRSLGAYRISQTISSSYGDSYVASYLHNLPLDDGIPQSGTISFGNFLGKRLNVVQEIPNTGSNLMDVNSQYYVSQYYNTNSTQWGAYTVIGGFKSLYFNEIKLLVFINCRIGTDPNLDPGHAAYSVGDLGNHTIAKIIIGPTGELYGAGGAGGNFHPGLLIGTGTPGTNAILIDHPSILINYGYIQAGFGGGGAGAWRER
jgi:hypothetical protein